MSLSPVIKKVLALLLCGAVLVALVFMVRYYKSQADKATERLQEVTTALTAANDRYDAFVSEQNLIRDVLTLGAQRKEQAKESTNEAVKVHRASGTRVTVSKPDADLLLQRSREVREAAVSAQH